MKDYTEHFNSIEAFAAAIGSRKVNPVFANKTQMSGYTGAAFTRESGTESYEQANGLLLNGDKDIYKKLVPVIGRVSATCETSKRVHDVCGFGVSVPRALTGSAKCMFSRKKMPSDGKILDVVINSTVAYNYKASDINAKLCQMFSIINMLERNDVQTNIYIFMGSSKNGQKVAVTVKVKDAGQPFNLLKYAYPCANPSMLRRHYFKFMETIPAEIERGFVGGYGAPMDSVPEGLFNFGENKYIFNLQKELVRGRNVEDITADVLKVVNE